MKLDKQELVKYELPSWTEFCSIGWIQTILARHYAGKVNRKFARYEKRIKREEYLRARGLIN